MNPLSRQTGLAIVAPGGYAPDESLLARACDRLAAQGYAVRSYYDHATRHQRFGATDAERVAQLHAAARDPDVAIVMALRGGYGMSRLLPQIDFELLAASGKRFVGHSDFTALQMGLLATTGAPSFAGPMICDDFTRDDPSGFTMESFRACLHQRTCTIEAALPEDADDNPVMACEGTLWGGNLTMLTHLVGTPWMPAISGGILFVEDVNEHPYRVERMLLQLFHAGILARQTALVLGDFSNYRLSPYDNGYDFAPMLAWLRETLPIPVVSGLPFGHLRDKVTLPVGAHAQLHATARGLLITASGYPALPA